VLIHRATGVAGPSHVSASHFQAAGAWPEPTWPSGRTDEKAVLRDRPRLRDQGTAGHPAIHPSRGVGDESQLFDSQLTAAQFAALAV
jgi:hypothetical protein